MFIDDGKGSGRRAGINDENRLLTDSVSASVEHHINHHDGLSFNVVIDQAPTAANDCIFYMENTDEKDLIVEGVMLSVTGAAEIYFQVDATGTRNSATDVTPVNLNRGSGKTATGNFEYGADLDGGAATLAGGTEVDRYIIRAAKDSTIYNFEQDLVLPKSRTLSIWSSSTETINATIFFNYHDKELG